MKIKKIGIYFMAGMLACSTPVITNASELSESVVNEAVEILENSEIDSLLSDPDKVVEIIMYIKDFIGEQEVSDELLYNVIHMAEENLQIDISDSEEKTLVKLFYKFKDMDLDKEELRKSVYKIYDTMEKLGITEEDVKGVLGEMIEFVKNILN